VDKKEIDNYIVEKRKKNPLCKDCWYPFKSIDPIFKCFIMYGSDNLLNKCPCISCLVKMMCKRPCIKRKHLPLFMEP